MSEDHVLGFNLNELAAFRAGLRTTNAEALFSRAVEAEHRFRIAQSQLFGLIREFLPDNIPHLSDEIAEADAWWANRTGLVAK